MHDFMWYLFVYVVGVLSGMYLMAAISMVFELMADK